MLFVSTFVLEPALVFAKLLLVKYRGTASAFAVSPIAKKKIGFLLLSVGFATG